tara:strand:+ start:240 stop:1217 length:978 start_codon:yes stop_codon:yes gene_type:complete
MTTHYYNTPKTTENSSGAVAMPTPQDVSPPTNNVPQVNAPCINSSAMLVETLISQWMARRKDVRASAEVTASNNAESGVANVSKKLLGNCAELDAVHKLTGSIRNTHYAMTMPWSDTGLRLLPTAQYFKYHQTMTDLEAQWHVKVDAFLSTYQWDISQAHAKLGDLMDMNDYPTTDAVAAKFAFNINYIPLPDSGDFRIDIGNDAVAEVKSSYDDYYQRQLGNAMHDVWTRLHTALSRMSERLTVSDDGKKQVFRDSLVGNVLDMVELLDVCNVTGDSQMAALKTKLSEAMYGITADALREDTHTRTETKRTVDQIIATLPSLEV